MNFSEFRDLVQGILDIDLPPGEIIIAEGRETAKHIKIGRTAFMDKMGVSSEAEYKRACIRNNHIMFHAHVGMGTWSDTAKALEQIYSATEELGLSVDRAGICLDRRMGLPKNMRQNIPAETGPMLLSMEDWMQVGQVAPIQPHMGDFMIGFPSSSENTINALTAGVTTIGNLSQYFAHEVPSWRDHVTTTAETVRALSIMGVMRNQGVLLHSYLEDGFGALFHDCVTIAGWAFLESYIVEHLMGAKLSHCIGGLTSDHVKRAGWVFALNEIHQGNCLGSMIYGDTISFTRNYTVNRAHVGEYLLWDIMTQLECPTGHAVLPLPVTESFRIPSAEEILEAQIYGRRIEAAARRLWPHVDFTEARDFSRKVVRGGKRVFSRALDGLKESGADIEDPIQLLYLLKMIGPAVFEKMFGRRGTKGQDTIQEPEIPSDMYMLSRRSVEENRSFFHQPEVRNELKGRRMLIASTDVHEHAVQIIAQLLSEAWVEIVNMGAEQDPNEVADKAAEHHVDAILISTHNGMALDYATQLKKELSKRKVQIPVIMGGMLNQKVENSILPVDVSKDLRALGFKTCSRLGMEIIRLLPEQIKT